MKMIYLVLFGLTLAARQSETSVSHYEQTLHAKLFGGEALVDVNGTATLKKFPKTYNKAAHPTDLGSMGYYNDTYWDGNYTAFKATICAEYEYWIATYIYGDEDADVSQYIERDLGGADCLSWLDEQLTPDLEENGGSFTVAYYKNYNSKYSTVGVEEYPGRVMYPLGVDIILQIQGINESKLSFCKVIKLVYLAIVNLNEENADLTVSMGLFWQDDRLSWDLEEFNGIAAISVNLHDIWTPDVQIINRGHEFSTKDEYSYKAKIYSSGFVNVIRNYRFKGRR